MKSLQDTLYNWLTIKVVNDFRPDDTAARDTRELFEDILSSDLRVENIEVTSDDIMYYVLYDHEGERKKTRFPRELIEVMLNQINQDPEKYSNYPVED